MNIVLLGAPGSGKGTAAKLLLDKYDLTHLSTGDMLRETMKKKSILGRTIKRLLQTGKLVPDAVVTRMLLDRMFNDPNVDGFILDGFPRTLAQAETLEEYGIQLDIVVHLDVKKDVAVQRMLKRGRADDTEKIIEKRFEIYNKQMNDLIKFYSKYDGYVRIDANHTAEKTQAAIEKYINANR